MDGILLLILIIIVCFYYRNFYKIVNAVAIIDIFLRIFHFVIFNVEIRGISEHIEKYLPDSVPTIIESNTSGLLSSILVWLYVINMTVFLIYIIRLFFTRKKIM